MLTQILNPDNYCVTTHAAASMSAGAAIAALGIFVLVKEHGSRTGVAFWILTVCISIWLTGLGAAAASAVQSQALCWMRFALAGVVFIPFTILLLIAPVVEVTPAFQKLFRASLVASTLFCISVLFTDLYIRGLYHYSWGFFPRYGPHGVSLQVEMPDTLPVVNVDPLHMEQVFQNLVTNAIQAMPDGGDLHIIAKKGGGDQEPVEGLVGAGLVPLQKNRNFIEIFVTDSGEGISPDNMNKLFQPLFTTKARGIGLGLTVVKNLVEANGGSIEVESEAGKGTIFTVILPC